MNAPEVLAVLARLDLADAGRLAAAEREFVADGGPARAEAATRSLLEDSLILSTAASFDSSVQSGDADWSRAELIATMVACSDGELDEAQAHSIVERAADPNTVQAANERLEAAATPDDEALLLALASGLWGPMADAVKVAKHPSEPLTRQETLLDRESELPSATQMRRRDALEKRLVANPDLELALRFARRVCAGLMPGVEPAFAAEMLGRWRAATT
jgi:hypothetical protein